MNFSAIFLNSRPLGQSQQWFLLLRRRCEQGLWGLGDMWVSAAGIPDLRALRSEVKHADEEDEDGGAQGKDGLGFAASPGTASWVSWESCSGKGAGDTRNIGQTNPERAS